MLAWRDEYGYAPRHPDDAKGHAPIIGPATAARQAALAECEPRVYRTAVAG